MASATRRAVVCAFVALVGLATVLAGPADASVSTRKLPTRTIEAGEVTVELTPTRVDEDGAVVKIVLDTHAVELDLNVRRGSTLKVDGVVWPTVSYQGDGPGGHHREGTLRFRAKGPPTGELRLRISGLPERVNARWQA